MDRIAHFHLPGLFEFYDLYKVFLPLYKKHRDYFYEWSDIASIYGSPSDCMWSGGRTSFGNADIKDVTTLMNEYKISPRLTLSNSLINAEHLKDKRCNELCKIFSLNTNEQTGIIIYSDLLLNYLKDNYPKFYFVSSTTKVLDNFDDFLKEINRDEFKYVVIDFRLNKEFEKLNTLKQVQKDKVEFLVNECCDVNCKVRKACYQNVSLKNIGENIDDFACKAPLGNIGYRFSDAKKNPSFISRDDIKNIYLANNFTNFKIEGRGLGSALILEFLLYYLVKPDYELNVREEIYLDSMLDLF